MSPFATVESGPLCGWENGVEVPCVSDQGKWYSPQRCYIGPVDPLLPYTDASCGGTERAPPGTAASAAWT